VFTAAVPVFGEATGGFEDHACFQGVGNVQCNDSAFSNVGLTPNLAVSPPTFLANFNSSGIFRTLIFITHFLTVSQDSDEWR